MFALEILSPEARRSFLDSFLEGLKVEAKSPRTRISDLEVVERLVKINEMRVKSEPHRFSDHEEFDWVTHTHHIFGVDVEGTPLALVVEIVE